MLDEYLKKYHAILLPIFSIVIGVAILGLIVIRQALDIPKINNQIDELKAKNVTLQKKLFDLNSIDTQTYKQSFDIALTAIPSDKDLPGAFGQLLLVLQNNGLTLDDINFGNSATNQATTVSNVNELVLRASVSGPTTGIQSFMDKLNQIPRVMKINTLDLTSSNNSQANVSINLTSFYQSLPTTVGNVEQPISTLSEKDKELLKQVQSYINNLPQQTNTPTGPVGKSNPFE